MPRVLVVDDEPDLRFVLRRLLESAGYEVDEAMDGMSALDRFREEGADLVITDGDMPRMDGAELISTLREEGGGQLPIILWSTNPSRYRGANASFAKPYGGRAIVERAQRLLQENGS